LEGRGEHVVPWDGKQPTVWVAGVKDVPFLAGGFKYFLCSSPKFGEDFQFD